MEKFQHTIESALETIVDVEQSFTELETKLAALFKTLEAQGTLTEPVLEIFRTFSQIRFHLAEAGEYQGLLEKNRKTMQKAKTGNRRGPRRGLKKSKDASAELSAMPLEPLARRA